MNPATGGGENAGVEGEDQDIIFSYDDKDRLVNITIENASKRADLSDIKSNNNSVLSGKGVGAYSITSVAKEMAVSRHTIHAIIKKMKDAGHKVGSQMTPNASIVLTHKDVDAIKKWRAEHPNGRPTLAKAE